MGITYTQVGKKPPRWFAPSAIPPILLLTIVTSFAFNHALISTQRKQDLRNHRIYTHLLQDTISYNTKLLHHLNPPSSSWFHSQRSSQEQEQHWITQERDALIRRWRALGMDPLSQKWLVSNSNTIGEMQAGSESDKMDTVRVGPKQVTWNEIFFGSKEKRSSLTQRWQKVTAGIKDTFTNLNPTISNLKPNKISDETISPEEEKQLQELSQLWSRLSKES